MTIKSSGQINISDIVSEFGATAPPFRLKTYYRGGSNVPDIAANASIPTSGDIFFSDFYGARALYPVCQFYTEPGTFSYVVPPNVTQIKTIMCGSGGSGGSGGSTTGGNYDYQNTSGGGGGTGGEYTEASINVTPGETLTIVVGVGGSAVNPNGGDANGNVGLAGNQTIIKRGSDILVVANGGLGGKAGSGSPYTGAIDTATISPYGLSGGRGGQYHAGPSGGYADYVASAGSGPNAGDYGSSVTNWTFCPGGGGGGTYIENGKGGAGGGNGAAEAGLRGGGGGGGIGSFSPTASGKGGDGFIRICPVNTKEYTIPGTYTIALPAGSMVTVSGCGGSGGGGGGDWGDWNHPGGGGGGGSNIVTSTFTLTESVSLTITVGGAGGAGPHGGAGYAGGASTVVGTDVNFSALGGGGGGGSNHGGGYPNDSHGGVGANGANNGQVGGFYNATGGTSTNGGTNGGRGTGFGGAGLAGASGRIKLTW